MSELPTYYIDTGDGVTGVRMDGTSVRRVRPAPEPLLTREEAANDPEVRAMIDTDYWGEASGGGVTDDE